MRVLLAATTVLLACGLARGAAAQEAAAVAPEATVVDLALEVPDGPLECLRGTTLREAVQTRVAQEGLTEPVAVAVTAWSVGEAGWRVGVGLAAADGVLGSRELTLEEADCGAVADAIALVVVLALRGPSERVAPMTVEELPAAAGDALSRPPARSERMQGLAPGTATDTASSPPTGGTTAPAPAATRENEGELVRPASRPPDAPAETSAGSPSLRPASGSTERESEPSEPWSWGLSVGAGLRAGILPTVNAAGALSVSLQPPADFRLLLSVVPSLPQLTEVAEGEVWLFHAELRVAACAPLLAAGGATLEGCAVVAPGLLLGEASGFAVWNGSATRLTLGMGVAARLEQRIGPGLALFLAVEGDVAVLRPSFYVRESSDRQVQVHQLGYGSMLATAGLAVSFE